MTDLASLDEKLRHMLGEIALALRTAAHEGVRRELLRAADEIVRLRVLVQAKRGQPRMGVA